MAFASDGDRLPLPVPHNSRMGLGRGQLVGGNGTVFNSGKTGYEMMKVDTAATAEYLTAGIAVAIVAARRRRG